MLAALSEASAFHHDLRTWLSSRLPGMELTPLELLRDDKFRAFRGAIRARPAPEVTSPAGELARRRREQVSWVVPEPPTVPDDEE